MLESDDYSVRGPQIVAFCTRTDCLPAYTNLWGFAISHQQGQKPMQGALSGII